MNEQIIAEGTIVNLFKLIVDIPPTNLGIYELFGPCDADKVLPDLAGAIVFTLREDDEGPFVTITDTYGNQLCTLGAIDLIQDVVKVALEDKPGVSWEELVEAFDYYIEHDAFMPFE